MKPITAVPFCAVVLTVVALLALQEIKVLPIWPVFIAWACFCHLGGGKEPRAAIRSLLVCLLFGVFMGWLSALAILTNPLGRTIPDPVSGAVIAGIAIGVISALAFWKALVATPVCVYGYAATWGFLDVPGRFDLSVLTSFSAENVMVALPCAFVFGGLSGYMNARLVDLLVPKQCVAG